jgi:hypothetical protein
LTTPRFGTRSQGAIHPNNGRRCRRLPSPGPAATCVFAPAGLYACHPVAEAGCHVTRTDQNADHGG